MNHKWLDGETFLKRLQRNVECFFPCGYIIDDNEHIEIASFTVSTHPTEYDYGLRIKDCHDLGGDFARVGKSCPGHDGTSIVPPSECLQAVDSSQRYFRVFKNSTISCSSASVYFPVPVGIMSLYPSTTSAPGSRMDLVQYSSSAAMLRLFPEVNTSTVDS